jgi:hypothetical protein
LLLTTSQDHHDRVLVGVNDCVLWQTQAMFNETSVLDSGLLSDPDEIPHCADPAHTPVYSVLEWNRATETWRTVSNAPTDLVELMHYVHLMPYGYQFLEDGLPVFETVSVL